MECFDIHTHSIVPYSGRVITSFSVGIDTIDVNVPHISVGIHPWFLTLNNVDVLLDVLYKTLKDKRVVALGEAGLDKLKGVDIEAQIAVFCKEVTISEELKLPMVIHCVKAFNELIELKKVLRPRQPWIIHGFRGKKNMAVELLRHGFYLSFGSHFQEEAVRVVPFERLFVETDESQECIEVIYRRIAEVKGISPEELAEVINKNVSEIFFKP